MVDFRFDIKPLFPEAIVRVTSNLLPHNFRGDRRQCLDATSKMSEIIDRLGELSAASQGLSKPVTTAQRLRMSENQTIYLLADTEAGHNGSVTGLLKVGNKDLYLFDEAGQTRKVERAPSILDFYVHESRQRAGLGKMLFETMLREENWTPLKCSVDRPSEKLLAFFGKHYGLVRTIPQSNNFVLYEGYFNESNSSKSHARAQSPQEGLHFTDSPNTQLFGATYLGKEVDHRRRGSQQQKQKPDHINTDSPNGRYGARHPTCTMGESRHGQQAAGGQVGTMSRKHASEASLTPSQAKRDTENPRKSPLDALSRAGTARQQDPFQRRSGLQDVDDAFLATNAFARPSRVRHSGLDGWTDGGAAVPPAGTAAVAPIRMSGGQEQSQPPQAAAPTQEQQQTPPPQQQSPPVAAVPSQQQFMQQPAAGQPTRHEPHPTGRAHVHHNQQQQHQQAAYDQQQQQQQMAQQETQSMGQSHPQGQLSPRKYQQQTQQQSQGFIISGISKCSTKGDGTGNGDSSSGNGDIAEHMTAQMDLHHLEDEQQAHGHMNTKRMDLQEVLDEEEAHLIRYGVQPQMKEPQHEFEPEAITPPSPEVAESVIGENRRPAAFHLSKQHTGMKNRSSGVGTAVMPSSKMEFNQEGREDFGVVKITRPPGHEAHSPGHDYTDTDMSSGRGEHLTNEGYNDLKFHHNKLCKREYFEQIYGDYML